MYGGIFDLILEFGTVKVCVCDVVPFLEEMVNLAGLIQCLEVGLSNFYDDRAQLSILEPWVIQKNKWRATRFGLDADIMLMKEGVSKIQKELFW